MKHLAQRIIDWYKKAGRDLPWRKTDDPYKIWISEIILQQTRVMQGLPYYHKFLKAYPTLRDFANASEKEILKLWQGLGYYSRAGNMIQTAKILAGAKYEFPQDYYQLRALPGIGDYTASAIASLAFGKPHAVVDGNVLRVISRIFGITDPIDTTKSKSQVKKIAGELIIGQDPGLFNQAILDFGAIQCVPKNPDCSICISNEDCFALRSNRVHEIPFKKAKPKVKMRYFNYLVIKGDSDTGQDFALVERKDSDIWKGLYEFLLIETEKDLGIEQLVLTEDWQRFFSDNKSLAPVDISRKYIHKLSHQHIIARFYLIRCETEDITFSKPGVIRVRPDKLYNYPVSRLIDRFMEDYPVWISDKKNSEKN